MRFGMMYQFQFDEPTCVTFLQPCKKVTKEDGIGEALTAKPIGIAGIVPKCFPGFEPPSPMYPFRRWTEDYHWSIQ